MHPADRQLQRRLTREARLADRAATRVHHRHLREVARRERLLRRARRHLPVQASVALGSLLSVMELGTGKLWLLVAVVVMVYFARRTMDAIEHPPSSMPPTPVLIASPLPDAPDVTEIKVIPTRLPIEYKTLLAVNAWASPRATVADCSPSL